MKVIITENQLLRLFESNTLLDNLNNLIDPNKFSYEYGWKDSTITPDQVFMEGSVEDEDITIHVNIGIAINTAFHDGIINCYCCNSHTTSSIYSSVI